MGEVALHRQDGIARIELSAPPMNALSRAMIARLEQVLQECEQDGQVRALVVHGAGTRAFSAGSDLGELRGLMAQGEAALDAKFEQDLRVFSRLAHFPKPTLAAIEGAAIGGGLELAVGCDFVIAGRSAQLSLPEIRLGVFPGSGGTVTVTRRIGAARAQRMMMLGSAVDPQAALAWGLVDEVCDDGGALTRALALAARFAVGPALAYQGLKASIRAATEQPEVQALQVARQWAVRLGFSADLAEGLKAFEEKRPPRFGPRPPPG